MDLRRRRSPPSVASGEEAALQEALDRLEDSGNAEARGTASTPSVTGPRADAHEVAEEKNVEAKDATILPVEPLRVSPFWSPTALLARARPGDMDEAEPRVGNPMVDGVRRPASLEDMNRPAGDVKVGESGLRMDRSSRRNNLCSAVQYRKFRVEDLTGAFVRSSLQLPGQLLTCCRIRLLIQLQVRRLRTD